MTAVEPLSAEQIAGLQADFRDGSQYVALGSDQVLGLLATVRQRDAEIAELRAAVRGHAIARGAFVGECCQCWSTWPSEGMEQHTAGCPAAPLAEPAP